jgi:hypothetical protein
MLICGMHKQQRQQQTKQAQFKTFWVVVVYKAACMHCHRTNCPLLTAFFLNFCQEGVLGKKDWGIFRVCCGKYEKYFKSPEICCPPSQTLAQTNFR